MVYKKLLGSMLALSLFATAPSTLGMEEKKEEKKEHKSSWFKDLSLGALSLGAVAGAGYGYYWANDYNLKKTVKPFIGIATFGCVMTAGYLCAGKYILKSMVAKAKKKMEKLKADAKKTFGEFKTDVTNKIQDIKTGLTETLQVKIELVKTSLAETLKDKIDSVKTSLSDAIKGFEASIVGIFSTAKEEKMRNKQAKEKKKRDEEQKNTKEFVKKNGKGVDHTANVMNTTQFGKINLDKFVNGQNNTTTNNNNEKFEQPDPNFLNEQPKSVLEETFISVEDCNQKIEEKKKDSKKK